MEKFDLFIVNPIQIDNSSVVKGEDIAQEWHNRGLIKIGKDLGIVRRILSKILSLKGNAYVIPASYRKIKVQKNEALSIAMLEHERMLKDEKRLSNIHTIKDDILWWTFIVDDIQAIENDFFPGQITISVDKLTGRIRNREEYQQWLKLSDISDNII